MGHFYSRPRVGGDLLVGEALRRVVAISTHAPAWGATALRESISGSEFLFLLTPQNRGRTHRRGTPQAETGV